MNRFNHSNEPVPTIEPVKQPKAPVKNYTNVIIGALAATVLGLGIYLVVDKTSASSTIKQQESALSSATMEKSEVQTSFDASLARLDSMSTVNNGLNTELKEKNDEIARVKEEIRSILNKQDATRSELAKAKSLISKLNSKIANLQEEVARLREDNNRLTQELETSHIVKQELEKKVDIASTLNASNILITPVNVKKSGKEKVSTSARRADKMVVSFDVANRIVQTGTTDLYVIVLGPDGQPVTGASAPGSFTTREEGDKTYTARVAVDLETAKTKKVAFSFVPASHFQKGNYTIQIYQNGFLIGEGTRSLRKGGLFG